jgi:hypothetical protein
MSEQVGWRGLLRTLRKEAPYWAQTRRPAAPAAPAVRRTAWVVCKLRWIVLAARTAARYDLLAACWHSPWCSAVGSLTLL